MAPIGRRTYLVVAGAALAGLAGCTEGEGEFVVSATQIVHQSGDHRLNHPEDMLVRVSLENSRGNRQQATLDVTLEYDPGTGEDAIETWTKTDEVEVSHAASLHPEYVFEDVFEEGNDLDDYSVETELDVAE